MNKPITPSNLAEIRKNNLLSIIENFHSGEKSKCADKLNISSCQIYFYAADKDKKYYRNIGDNLARRIERAYKLDPYSFDSPMNDIPSEDVSFVSFDNPIKTTPLKWFKAPDCLPQVNTDVLIYRPENKHFSFELAYFCYDPNIKNYRFDCCFHAIEVSEDLIWAEIPKVISDSEIEEDEVEKKK